MSNTTNVVAQIDTVIKNVRYDTKTKPPSYKVVEFSYYNDMYDRYKEDFKSLKDIEQLVNTYEGLEDKDLAPCLLKGIYSNEYLGKNIISNAPYLFFDIDVKDKEDKKENTDLLNKGNNEAVFNFLKEISVLVWRSNSGNGIAGVFYVPELINYLWDKKDEHKAIGKAITEYVSRLIIKEIGINVKFDDAQSRLRQYRYLAKQKVKRELNTKPYAFYFDIEKRQRKLSNKYPSYRLTNGFATGSIFQQFNQSNNIRAVLFDNGFTEVKGSKDRVKYYLSDSKSSGLIDEVKNTYVNFSGSFGDSRPYSPAEIITKERFSNDWRAFAEFLSEQGYKNTKPTVQDVKDVKNSLSNQLQQAKTPEDKNKAIFESSERLRLLSETEKTKFIDEISRPEDKEAFYTYFGLADEVLQFSKRFEIKKYVSEQLENLLNYADQQTKIVLQAETGNGKTYSFIKYFHKYRPEARILFLVPLTVIIDQQRAEAINNGFKGVFLDGSSTSSEHLEALSNGFVFATYEQGTKVIASSDFDYIVIDEFHQLINANSYKYNAVHSLTEQLELTKAKVIGLTGTADNIYKNIGFDLVEIYQADQTKTVVNYSYSNLTGFNIAFAHIIQRESKGKLLIRLNEIKTLSNLKKQLVKYGIYEADEVLIFHSTNEIKNGKDFKELAQYGKFDSKVKLILTTSLIDEGLSINQMGFTDIVFIETSFKPNPEPIKQFFARFRNTDPDRTNYLYLRDKKDQTPTRYRAEWSYKSVFNDLSNDVCIYEPENEINPSYSSLFTNAKFYYQNLSINKFYLAYTVLFVRNKLNNNQQFNKLLERYNISLKVSDVVIQELETPSNTDIKNIIAKYWINKKDEVLQILKTQSRNTTITRSITRKQMLITADIKVFVSNYIKDFETLYNRFKEVQSYTDVEHPNSIIIDTDKNGFITPTTNKKYNDWLLLQKIHLIVTEPKTKTDYKTKERLLKFNKWALEKQSFTTEQMFKQLKSLRLYDKQKLTKQFLIDVLKIFGFDVTECKQTRLIKVSIQRAK